MGRGVRGEGAEWGEVGNRVEGAQGRGGLAGACSASSREKYKLGAEGAARDAHVRGGGEGGGKPSRELLGRPRVLRRGRKPEGQLPGSKGAPPALPPVSAPEPARPTQDPAPASSQPGQPSWEEPKPLFVTRGRLRTASPPLPAFLYSILASILPGLRSDLSLRPNSALHSLCDPWQATSPLPASVSPSVKWDSPGAASQPGGRRAEDVVQGVPDTKARKQWWSR